jgi:hypothetical protein
MLNQSFFIMKKKLPINRLRIFALLFITLFFSQMTVLAQASAPLRRPISPQQPMYLVHIDTWNYADPQKIIDLIPQDIRPFVVMNISLSISHNTTTGQFQVAEYGYEIAKSWLRTCAQNKMWAIVQCASGGMQQFSEFDLSVYEELYRTFPNLIGFNYAEQFWGYDDANDHVSVKWSDGINHFAKLLELSNRFGGYLVVSWCGNQWSTNINPIGMLKRVPAFATACEKYTENYILCEKYTTTSYQSDMESLCLGAYLSGYSGNYGIRYDDTGWTDATGTHANFSMATSGAVHFEHIMLTGQTVVDGPELIWTQCFKETSNLTTADGYKKRNWETFPQFINVSIDNFRKVLDGTVRIPTRQEVINRTKVVIVNDVNNSNNNDTYSSPQTLFEGLYRMDGDGNYEFNKYFFKKTGRYPTIPTVFRLDDEMAKSFQYQVNRSQYATRWPSVTSKVTELNSVFPEEYTGTLYAGRHENGWVIYNPFKTGVTANASIPFKYNTCERVDLTFSQYTASVMKEFSDHVTFYLSNYDNVINTGLKTDIIKIYGSSAEPTFSFIERGNHQASVVGGVWDQGVYTLTVQHNGALDVTINCAGTATGRLTSFTTANIVTPAQAPLYTGPCQYEAECFDFKNISSITTSGYNSAIRNYSGQGYMRVGISASANVRDTVFAYRSGKYSLITKYSVTGGDVNTMDLYVNGNKVVTPVFAKTATNSAWAYNVQTITLNAGKNEVMFKANSAGAYSLYFDNIVITQGDNSGVYHFENDLAKTEASTPPAELITINSGSAGVVLHTGSDNSASNCFKAYSNGATNSTGVATLDMFPVDEDYSIVWKQYCGNLQSKNGVLLRANGSSTYADGLKQGYLFVVENNANRTMLLKNYVVNGSGTVEKLSYTTSFNVAVGEPCWLRATAKGDKFTFECSNDSITWEGAAATTFTDASYAEGATQMVWGLGSANIDWVVDNIGTVMPGSLTTSIASVNNLSYQDHAGPSTPLSFNLFANGVGGDIMVSGTDKFEVSLEASSGYSQSLAIETNKGNVIGRAVYVRLKEGLAIGAYSGVITINAMGIPSDQLLTSSVDVSGEVLAIPFSKKYDFTNDVASTLASNPPAANIAMGIGNTATAGVVSYTDNQSVTSNCFKPYTGGQRNGTGVVDLSLFPQEATNYSVTWKQCKANVTTETKFGVLLRGDASIFGGTTTGYVDGIRQGYVFIVYNNATGTAFRIYKSTLATTLNMVANNSVALVVTADQPVWYRASVSGTNPVTLKFEYSTNNVNWTSAATTTDSSTPFQIGSTQVVWGLATDNSSVRMDDVEFYGIANDNTTSVIDATKDQPVVVSKEYYNLNGQRIRVLDSNNKGIFIIKQLMSDGTVLTEKVLVK